MPTASKVLVVCVLLVSLGFFWLATSVLEARSQWDAKVRAKAGEAAKVAKEIDVMQNGSEEVLKTGPHSEPAKWGDFQKLAVEVLTLGSEAALKEYQAKLAEGFPAATAFQVAMKSFVDKSIMEHHRSAVDALYELQKSPTIEETEWLAAVRDFESAEKDLGVARENLDKAYAMFLGQTGTGGVRILLAKGFSVDAMKDLIRQIRLTIVAEQTVFNTQKSHGEKNETQLKDRWQETVAEARTYQQAADGSKREMEERTKEVEQLESEKKRELMALADEEEKRDKLIAEYQDLKKRFDETLARCRELTQKVKVAELKVDSTRGNKTVVLTPNGIIPTGRIQEINDADDTIRINLGRKVGVESGAHLHVYRWTPQAKYLGILEVIQTETDSAVGRMLPEYRQVPLKPGDSVSPEIVPPGTKKESVKLPVPPVPREAGVAPELSR